jgi:hypothetical protein
MERRYAAEATQIVDGMKLHENLYLALVRAARPGGEAAANKVKRYLEGSGDTAELPTATELAQFEQDNAEAADAAFLAFNDESVRSAAMGRILHDVGTGRARLTKELARLIDFNDRALVSAAEEEWDRQFGPMVNVTERPPIEYQPLPSSVDTRARSRPSPRPQTPPGDEDDESTMEYRAGHQDMPFVNKAPRRKGQDPAALDPMANVTQRKPHTSE